MDSCKDEWEKKPNNCSAPVIKEVVDNAFQGACFLHDLCYLSWNTEQKDCDDWFLHNMKQICSIHPKCPTLFLCNAGAHTVHLAVNKLGRSKFDEAKSWTKKTASLKASLLKAPHQKASEVAKALGLKHQCSPTILMNSPLSRVNWNSLMKIPPSPRRLNPHNLPNRINS